MAPSATTNNERTHLDIHDRTDRQNVAQRLGISEEKLKKAVSMVGTRISTIRGHIGN
ncbi:DUF3606 domain-containing protein [Methylobacterium sp. J-070]|uniref:DUF3606 domain-containing protein n=1 Tax=Methylobacterium sp. J-070 TaxID=2836650 RepID=UPI001FBA21A2|nr:DUF3606 domain-containing protein [Methylobacterium sp. J-070]MCJ2054222.1 DUF3606 domain-containing protein [Methylobacterium sp. J-070]